MDELVAAYLDRTRAAPFVWGQMDCALWAAGVLPDDPVAPYRGLYDSAFGARRLIMQNGGFEPFCRRVMAGYRAGETRCGPALARVDGKQICGLLRAGWLNLKTDGGLRVTRDFDLIEGWGFCHRL